MPNYQNAKIYKLWCHETDEIYIGSTTVPLSKRLGQHKYPNYTASSRILFEKSNNVMIELIEEYPCENKDQLTKREGELIRQLDCVNKRIEGRTKQEYGKKRYEENHDKFFQYRQDNRNKIREKQNQKIVCECGCETSRSNLAKHKRSNKHIEFINNYLP